MRFVSLFSGCGGLDLGLCQAGFEPVLALDSDPYCQESHRANFPGVPFYCGSIADIDSSQVLAMIDAARGDGLQPIDLLAGGPPCPPYSKSRFYRTDKPRALADPVGEVTLDGYLRFLRWLKPRAFLLENVPGLAYDVHREALEYIVTSAESEGYRCTYRVLNAADYGVPQIRERFFMIGLKDGQFEFPAPTHLNPRKSDGLFDRALPSWQTAGDALADLDTDENANDDGHYAGGSHHDLLRLVPPGENYLYFTEKKGYPNPIFTWRSRYWSFLLKLSPTMPSWTIQARRSNNMGPFHWRNRILRIDEIKRLQTFPDDWHLSGNIEKQWRQVGNAVPPKMAYQMGKAIMASLGAAKTARLEAQVV